jgi:carboxypeptidase C (cathepsin A)
MMWALATVRSSIPSQDVKAALHVGDGAKWTQSDETGPVADALLPDWTVDSDVVVEKLLALQLKVRMYNGVRDLSSCNHLGNQAVLNQLQWAGAGKYAQAPTLPWPSPSNVEGYMRDGGLLKYATVLRTGHLVPTVVPGVFKTLLAMMLL